MPKPRNQPRKYRRHASGQASITVNGRDIYLGKHGSPESYAEYARLMADLVAGRPVRPRDDHPCNLPISELLDVYTEHLRATVNPDKVDDRIEKISQATVQLLRIFGHAPARNFGPKDLKAVRLLLLDTGIGRSLINTRIGIIVRMFRWASSEELVPATKHHELSSVEPLKKDESTAKESRDVPPVSEEDIQQVLPLVSPQIRAVIQVQLYTGCRPAEALTMRGRNLDRSGDLWIYTPDKHKTEHHGKRRLIVIGKRAQAVIEPFLKLDPEAYLFSPKEAEEHRRREMATARRSQMTPSQAARAERRRNNPKRVLRDVYAPQTYRNAIIRACKKLGIDSWSPNQLRHTAATNIRKEFGLEAACAVLGHSSVKVTEIYAEIDKATAMRAIEQMG